MKLASFSALHAILGLIILLVAPSLGSPMKRRHDHDYDGGKKGGKKTKQREESVPGPTGCIFDIPESALLHQNKAVGKKCKQGKKHKKRQASCGDCHLDSIVSFGNFMSDVGASLLYSPCLDASNVSGPFCNARGSNGPLWVDFVAAHYQLGPLKVGFPGVDAPGLKQGGNSFAHDGARINTPSVVSGRTFQGQVRNYQVAIGQVKSPIVPNFKPNLNPPTLKTLHTVSFGGGDIQDVGLAFIFNAIGRPITNPQILLDAAIEGMITQLQVLYEMPQVCNVLVLGTLDFSITPVAQVVNSFYGSVLGVPGILAAFRHFSQVFNNEVEHRINQELLAKFNSKCSLASFGIKFIDTVDMMDRVLVPGNSEFPQPSVGCNERFRTSGQTCLTATKQNTSTPFLPVSRDNSDVLCLLPVLPNLELACDCDGLVWYDAVRPSTAFHKAIAEEAMEVLSTVCKMK